PRGALAPRQSLERERCLPCSWRADAVPEPGLRGPGLGVVVVVGVPPPVFLGVLLAPQDRAAALHPSLDAQRTGGPDPCALAHGAPRDPIGPHSRSLRAG